MLECGVSVFLTASLLHFLWELVVEEQSQIRLLGIESIFNAFEVDV